MTAAKKAPPRRGPVTAKVVPMSRPTLGVPAGRLLELQQETNLPEPYVITDEITIMPPTKKRADEIRESQMAIMVYSQLLSVATQQTVTEDELNGLTGFIKQAELDYNKALFGDEYEKVQTFFATQDAQLWKAFEADIQKRFFPNQPVDGKCSTCGQVVDEEAEGKASESTPSSSTGGTS